MFSGNRILFELPLWRSMGGNFMCYYCLIFLLSFVSGLFTQAAVSGPKNRFTVCAQSLLSVPRVQQPSDSKSTSTLNWNEINPQGLLKVEDPKSPSDNRFTLALRKKFLLHSKGPHYKDHSLLSVSKQMGFDIEQDLIRSLAVERELQAYFESASVEELSQDLLGPHSLFANNPLLQSKINEVLHLPNKSMEFKKDFLIRWHKKALVKSGRPLMEVLRSWNGLEKKLGGRTLYDVAFFQNLLTYQNNLDSFAQISVPMDGLLYLPGIDDHSLILYGNTNGTSSPLNHIYRANGETPISIKHINIFGRQTQSLDHEDLSVRFAAVITPPFSKTKSDLNFKSPSFVEGELSLLENEDFVVKPFTVSSDQLALSRFQNQGYVLLFDKGYRYASRSELGLTPTSKDLYDVFRISLSDAGIEKRNYELVEWPEGVFILELFTPLSKETQSHLESYLYQRLHELKDPYKARKARESPYVPFIPLPYAESAEVSGFTTVDEIFTALDLEEHPYMPKSPTLSRQILSYPYVPKIQLSPSGKATLILDDEAHNLNIGWGTLKEFSRAREKPMTALLVHKEIYAVYSERQRFPAHLRVDEIYTLFKSLTQAQYFIRTHRFVDREINSF